MHDAPGHRKQRTMTQQMKLLLVVLLLILAVYITGSLLVLGQIRRRALRDMDEMSTLYTNELDNRFHFYLYKACGSKILEHILSDYHHYVERVRKNTLSSQERARTASAEHKAILDAVINKDEELAERLANEHIFQSIANIRHLGLDNLMEKQEES